MSMTKFSGKEDPGYVKVSDLLWLWISEMENKKKEEERISDQSAGRSPATYGSINSGGGPIFFGSNNAGRDVVHIRLGRY
jgi:hypothetical protein